MYREVVMVDMYVVLFTASAVFWTYVTIALCICIRSNQQPPSKTMRRAMSRRDTLTANGKLTLLNELCE